MGERIHASLTADRVARAVEESLHTLSNPGFCIACGDEVEGVEPGAERYKCEACGALGIYGAVALLFDPELEFGG